MERNVLGLQGVGFSIMGKRRRLYDKIVGGESDANIPFQQITNMLIHLGFDERISGSHYVFTRDDITEIVNLQNVGGKCKPYQVKQVRNVLKKYNLREEL